jgi:Cytochrome c oxidase subunit IV
MRVEYKAMMWAAIFLASVAIVYGFWSRESTGTALLIFGTCAYGMIAGFLFLQWRRRQGIDRPEDRLDATQEDGAGEVGYFPAASIWPAGIGLGAVFVAIALIFGTWYWVPAGIFIIGGVAGFVVEAEAREE